MTPLFFDTETTGFIDFKKPLGDPTQPRIIQLAAILTDDAGEQISHMNVFILPENWVIGEEAFKVNGISQEFLCEHGIPMIQALERFNELKSRCTIRVAHNISFDKQMLAREALAYNIEHDSDGLESFCTMQKNKQIIKLPPSDKMMANGNKTYKNPNLQETYRHYFGKPFEGAHDALSDVMAVRDIFFAMQR